LVGREKRFPLGKMKKAHHHAQTIKVKISNFKVEMFKVKK
jgi:hypothetical protein